MEADDIEGFLLKPVKHPKLQRQRQPGPNPGNPGAGGPGLSTPLICPPETEFPDGRIVNLHLDEP